MTGVRLRSGVAALLLLLSCAAHARAELEGAELDDGAADSDERASSAAGEPRNLIGVALAQDFLLYGAEPAVCPSRAPDGTSDGGAGDYRCYAGDAYVPRPVYGPAGNEIRAGLGLATTRVLLGYDRRLGSRLQLGLRAGYAFGGPPNVPGASAFVPLHAELRGAYFFSGHPGPASGLAPYGVLGAGFAQVAGRVPLEVYADEAAYTADRAVQVDAWRKAGSVFVALGFGVTLPLGASSLSAELRALQLFGASASAVSTTLGYAYAL
jgi:hypothetical protein